MLVVLQHPKQGDLEAEYRPGDGNPTVLFRSRKVGARGFRKRTVPGGDDPYDVLVARTAEIAKEPGWVLESILVHNKPIEESVASRILESLRENGIDSHSTKITVLGEVNERPSDQSFESFFINVSTLGTVDEAAHKADAAERAWKTIVSHLGNCSRPLIDTTRSSEIFPDRYDNPVAAILYVMVLGQMKVVSIYDDDGHAIRHTEYLDRHGILSSEDENVRNCVKELGMLPPSAYLDEKSEGPGWFL